MSLSTESQWHLERTVDFGAGLTSLDDVDVVALPRDPPTNVTKGILIYVTVGQDSLTSDNASDYGTEELLATLYNWAHVSNTFLTMSEEDYTDFPACTEEQRCSARDVCRQFYHCFFDIWSETSINTADKAARSSPKFLKCLSPITTLRCGIWLTDRRSWETPGCQEDSYSLGKENWRNAQINTNLQRFLEGGQDLDHISWPGVPPGVSFSSALVSQMSNGFYSTCSLERPCTGSPGCNQIGSWRSSPPPNQVIPSRWGYFVFTSVQNINYHLSNQYAAIKGALGLLALDAFTINNYLPRQNAGLGLANVMTGLGTFLTIAGGFVPFVGESLVFVGTVLPTIGTFLSSAVRSRSDVTVGQGLYAAKVKDIYETYIDTISNVSSKLLAGEPITEGYNISTMMSEGAWVNSTTLPKLASLEKGLRLEILSRSINSLWKTEHSNKIWVLFVELANKTVEFCNEHKGGPPDSRYCADGGVYYTYNYIEEPPDGGSLGPVWGAKGQGYVSYPWGGKNLMPEHNIDLKWVTQSSAEIYKLAKKNGTVDPFNVTGINSTDLFLRSFVGKNTSFASLDQAGKYPGTWTVPVCNASTWGADWNWNYNSSSYDDRQKELSHPPCLCGENGRETDAWARAAGMKDFKTFRFKCRVVLEKSSFKWPGNLTSITYTGDANYTVKKPGT